MDHNSNPVIDAFVARFDADRAHYEKLCADMEKRIRQILKPSGILALVTARVKDSDRLKQKLINRDRGRCDSGKAPYGSPEELFLDIPDLIGIRIALYFPGDTAKVDEILTAKFPVVKKKVFPEPADNYSALAADGYTAHKRKIYPGYDNRRFDGYCAVHYRIRCPRQPAELPHPITIEIQVASVLMHAWSEVEHDLAYKKMMGDVTEAEYACLDEINGLVMAGEIALNRLSRLSRSRIQSTQTFDTHYTLAAYLSNWLKAGFHADHPLGDVKKLFDSYRQENLLTQSYLLRQLRRLEDQNWHENPDPLAAQLLEEFGRQDHQSAVTKASIQALLDMGETELSEAQLGRFLGRWNALDKRIREALRLNGYPNLYRTTLNRLVEERFVLSESFGRQYRELRMLRNQIVHDNLSPSMEEYRHIMAQIDELTEFLKTQYHIS